MLAIFQRVATSHLSTWLSDPRGFTMRDAKVDFIFNEFIIQLGFITIQGVSSKLPYYC